MASGRGSASNSGGGRDGRGKGGQGADPAAETPQIVTPEQLRSLWERGEEGLASLAAILNQAIAGGMRQAETVRTEEVRKEREDRAAAKKRKRDERDVAGELSTAALEKQRRKEERGKLRKERGEQRRREEERRKLPYITLGAAGIPTEMAYTGAKSTIRHIISTNFARGVEWGSLSKVEQRRCMQQIRDSFKNGGDIDAQWLSDKIANSMSQTRYHDRMKIRTHLRDLDQYRNLQRPLQFSEDLWNDYYSTEVQLLAAKKMAEAEAALERALADPGASARDLTRLQARFDDCEAAVGEVGNPPKKFTQARSRITERPNEVHRLGQGGFASLRAAFVSSPLLP